MFTTRSIRSVWAEVFLQTVRKTIQKCCNLQQIKCSSCDKYITFNTDGYIAAFTGKHDHNISCKTKSSSQRNDIRRAKAKLLSPQENYIRCK